MIEWRKKNRFSVGDVNFRAFALGLTDAESTLDEFVFQKPPWMVNRYAALIEQLKPKRIFELGIWRGGSCIFLQKLSAADKLVAVELREKRIEALDQYIALNALENKLRPFYGVDQSDGARLSSLAREEFEGGEIDLVIDDASHFLQESTASFNALFPLVRPGGVYVIEDWPWAHGHIDTPEHEQGWHVEREPLTKLLFQVVLACPSAYPLIEKIEVDRNSATIWRGEGRVEAEGFDIANCCFPRGQQLIR